MAIYGNVVGGSGGALGKTLILEDPSGIELVGVVTESEQVLDAKPSDIRVGKTAVTANGIVEGTNTITYRTEMSSILIEPGKDLSIPLSNYNRYDYTKIQCIVTKFDGEYGTTVNTKWITIDDSIFSIETSEKVATITKNSTTQSVDLNLTNNSTDIYEIFYFTYRDEEVA